MGLSDSAAAKRDAGLNPSVQADAKKERGHGRGRIVLHDRGGSPELRGVPLIGTGAGCISGTKPGPGASGRKLDAAAFHQAQHDRMIGREDQVWKPRLVVRERVSVSGILRITRSTV